MHTVDARKYGETEQRLYLLNAWREADIYTSEEKAILALTEEVTRISEHHVSDSVYDELRLYFDDKYIADAIVMIIAINAWNRIAISSGWRVS
jgi:alkylhydroperoxidase family enzyme